MGDDYVPSDWTEQDKPDNPLMDSGDDVAVNDSFDADFLGEAAPEKIEEGSFRPLPPGKHLCMIKDVKYDAGGKTHPVKAYVKLPDGTVEAIPYDARKVNVTFCAPNDPNLTVRDQFMMPPPKGAGREAYEHGFKTEDDAKRKKREDGGFWAKKLKQFLARAGFMSDGNTKLPAEAGIIANWLVYPNGKPRMIRLEVQPPTKAPDKTDADTGAIIPGRWFSNVGMFTYAYYDPNAGSKPSQPVKPAQAPAPSNGPAPAEEKPVSSTNAAPAKKGKRTASA